MNSILDNSIWPNLNGELGSITTPIPDGVTVKWPDGDALVGNFVYKDGKLVGFVDSKALIPNDTKTSNLPYDCVHTSFERILDSDFTFDGARKNHFEIKCSDLVNFAKINLSEILSDVKFVIDLDDSSENKLVIHTDRVDDSKLEEVSTTLSNVLPANIEVAQYNHNMEISWRDINKYAECETVNDLLAVNADYKNDLTSEGEWIYPLTSMSDATAMFESSGIVKFSADVRHIAKVERMFQFSPNMDGEVVFNSDVATNLTRVFGSNYSEQNKITKITLNAPNATNIDRVCNIDRNLIEVQGYLPKANFGPASFYQCYNLSIFGIELPSLNMAEFFFTSTKLNKESVLLVLNSIPSFDSGTRRFDIGIHIDCKNDEEVLNAIANAEAKGWTMSVQWTGTPTNSAASTFGFSQLIYAKVGEMEHPDGTTEKILDWGHYVTDPTGYETFHSLESAYEHFGLEMPFIGD